MCSVRYRTKGAKDELTNTMPRIVRITDLANPERTEALLARLAEAEHHPVELTVDAVLAAAAQATGLEDFGPPDFRDRLAVELQEVDKHPYNTSFGRLDFFQGMVRTGSNRLRIRTLITLHPEIEDI